MNWETFQFGQLFLNGSQQHIPENPVKGGDIPKYNGGPIEIGDSKTDKITWVKPHGMNLFIADRVLLSNVSWDDLNKYGFVEGKQVNLNGYPYRCRLLRVETNNNEHLHEWNKILNITTYDDVIWHWEDEYFWTASTADEGLCTVCGYFSAIFGRNFPTAERDIDVGFRPVLEPLETKTPPVGKTITLEGKQFVVSQLYGVPEDICYPQLSPVEPALFQDIVDGSVIRMYSALVNGKPVRMDLDETISLSGKVDMRISDKFYGEEFLISWVISNGCAMAVKPVFKKEV